MRQSERDESDYESQQKRRRRLRRLGLISATEAGIGLETFVQSMGMTFDKLDAHQKASMQMLYDDRIERELRAREAEEAEQDAGFLLFVKSLFLDPAQLNRKQTRSLRMQWEQKQPDAGNDDSASRDQPEEEPESAHASAPPRELRGIPNDSNGQMIHSASQAGETIHSSPSDAGLEITGRAAGTSEESPTDASALSGLVVCDDFSQKMEAKGGK